MPRPQSSTKTEWIKIKAENVVDGQFRNVDIKQEALSKFFFLNAVHAEGLLKQKTSDEP